MLLTGSPRGCAPLAGCWGAGPAPLSTPGRWRGGGPFRPHPAGHTRWGVQTQTPASISAPPPHWRRAPSLGIYESDDIAAIVSEMEKALNYSEKVRLWRVAQGVLALVSFLGLPRTAPPRTGWLQAADGYSLPGHVPSLCRPRAGSLPSFW